MKTYSNSILSILGAFLVLLSCACDPCDDVPATVRIDENDASGPEIYWEVETYSLTPSGPISSLQLFTDVNTLITINTNERAEIRLVANDPESGIVWLDIIGGFGYTCFTSGAAITLDGIIPGDRLFIPLAEEVCATVEASYPEFIIDATSLCGGEYPNLSNGSYQFNGSASNASNSLSLTTLTVNIVPAAI